METFDYEVNTGDSLSKIASIWLDAPHTWQTIASMNGLKSPYTIYPGQILKLPAYETKLVIDIVGDRAPYSPSGARRAAPQPVKEAGIFTPATVLVLMVAVAAILLMDD